jgi:YVTN family beta-propeller protein
MLPGALELRMLGPLEAWRDGERLPLGGQRQRSVLACLLLGVGHDVSSDRIVDAVWGERPPSGVTTTLQTYVFHLRRALEPQRGRGSAARVLVTVPGGYRLESAAASVDARRFEELLVAGRTVLGSDPAAAAAQLRDALSVWRGDVLSDLPSMQGVAAPAAARLSELRVDAAELWAEAELALGHQGALGALGALDELVTQHPLREHLAALRMLALYREGRQSDALAAYGALRRRLDDELGIRPSPEIEVMHQRILCQDPALATTRAAAPAPPVLPTAAGPVSPPAEPDDHAVAAEVARPRGRSRRGGLRGLSRAGWAAVVTVVALALTALVGSTLLVRRADLTLLPANSIGPVDDKGLRGDAVVLASAPTAMVSVGDAVWAIQGDTDSIVRIDRRTRAVTQTVAGIGRVPQALASAGEDLWVAAFAEGALVRFNTTTSQVVGKIPVGIDPAAVAVGPSGVWVANSGENTVSRVDPATQQVVAVIAVGDGPDALALEGSTLWVANGRSGTVSQLDTSTGERVAADIRVDAGPAALAVTPTDVWVANEAGQSVSRISRSTGRVQRIPVDDGPSSVVVVDDHVWVSNHDSNTVTRIDLGSNDAISVPVGGAPRALAVVDGELWAASSGRAGAEHRGGTLAWTGGPLAPTVDPAYAYFPTNQNLIRSVYDSLVAFRVGSGRASLGLVPDLATRLPEPADGGRTYVFTIRPDVHYSTGAVVAASDFGRGMSRALHPGAANPELLRRVVGAAACLDADPPTQDCDLSGGVVADDATGRLTIRLVEPDPELLEKLPQLLFPVPAGTPSGDQMWTAVPATGPYLISAAGPEGLTLTRNPYFDQWSSAAQPAGYPDVITYRPVDSPDPQGIADVLNGVADGVVAGTAPLPVSVTARPAYIHRYDALDLQLVVLNTHTPPFDDLRVRRALNYAVDRGSDAALGGPRGEFATPTCQLLPASIPGHRPYCPYQSGPADAPYRGPDLAKARALVAGSGTAGTPVVVHYGPGYGSKARGEYTAGVLRDLGYQVQVEAIPADAGEEVTSRYQVRAGFGWVPDYLLPGTFFDSQIACGAQDNYGRYCNRAVQDVADRARALRSIDPAVSLALWAEVDHMVTDDAPIVPFLSRVASVVVDPSVGNVITRAGFGPLLSQMWVV